MADKVMKWRKYITEVALMAVALIVVLIFAQYIADLTGVSVDRALLIYLLIFAIRKDFNE